MRREYVANGKTVVLEAEPELVAVRFREPAPHSMRAAVSEAQGLGPYPRRLEVPQEKYTILAAPGATGPGRLSATVDGLNDAREVARAAPVFRMGPNSVVATDRVIVAFAAGAPDPPATLHERGLEILERDGGRFVVRLGAYEDPFEVSEELRGLPGVRFAEPDFVTVAPHIARAPASAAPLSAAEPLDREQYALRVTRADEAQKLQPGDPAVRIAVLDEGVDTLHEDLKAAVVGGYDATDDDTYQEPQPWDPHGTACAGLAAAVPGNDLGIRGVGAGCSLLAVRIAHSDAPMGSWVFSNSKCARAIRWAARNGAAVLSNSWGGGAPSTDVTEAIEEARTQGRGGKGCVIVAAAGNYEGPVVFPATLPEVLAVAATDEKDEPKTRAGSDEPWWGSCFGPEVDIAAPGVHNLTTDVTGPGGYNKAEGPEGHYYPGFNGTSSATPIVAGAAALVLSANPDLTEAEVRRILLDTADKVGSVPYTDGRNDRLGHGRLNVLRAVRAARARSGKKAPAE